jgi:hypothetical protein
LRKVLLNGLVFTIALSQLNLKEVSHITAGADYTGYIICGDTDKDGFPNFMDCRPLNNKKHYVSERDPFYWAYREVFAGLRWGK